MVNTTYLIDLSFHSAELLTNVTRCVWPKKHFVTHFNSYQNKYTSIEKNIYQIAKRWNCQCRRLEQRRWDGTHRFVLLRILFTWDRRPYGTWRDRSKPRQRRTIARRPWKWTKTINQIYTNVAIVIFTMVHNNQKSGHKYRATRSSVRSFARTTHSLASSWGNERYAAGTPSCSGLTKRWRDSPGGNDVTHASQKVNRDAFLVESQHLGLKFARSSDILRHSQGWGITSKRY